MTERRNTVDTSSHGTDEITSQRLPPPAPPPDYRLVARSGQWVFSNRVIVVLAFISLDSFATYVMYYYIRTTFFPFCLFDHQFKTLLGILHQYYAAQVFIAFVPAIVADNYVRRDWTFEVMIAIGSFSSVVLCYLATISAQYTYSQSFDLKENVFIVFIAFQSMNEIARPLELSLLFDQIVNLRDFTLDTTRIFSVLFLAREVSKLITFALGLYTWTGKTAAAKVQIIPPIVSLGATFLFIFITWWKYPLISHTPNYNCIWKILGCSQQRCMMFIMKNIFRTQRYRPLIKYSERTRKEAELFWKINITMICAYPYYYCKNVTGLWSFTNISTDVDPRGKAIQQVCGQSIKLVFLAISQFVVFPILYRTRMKSILSSPVKRMITCYAVVGLCGLVTFIVICLNQRKGLALFHDKASKVIFLHNMLNLTVNVELFNTHGRDPLKIGPYHRHLIILENMIPLQVSIICKQLQMDDYHQLEVSDNDVFFITAFGLEGVKMKELADRGDSRESTLVVVCLLLVCRGSVIFHCNGQANAFELHNFGTKYTMSVKRGSKCKVDHYSTQGLLNTENSGLDILVSEPIYNVAAIESMESVITLKLLPVDEKPVVNMWMVLPVDLLSAWANMVFEIAFCQFVMIEGIPSCQTILVAIVFTYQNLATISTSKWMHEHGLVSENNAIVFSVIYLVFFVWFLTRLRHFHTATRIKQLHAREEEEMRFHESPRGMDTRARTLSPSPGPL